MTLIVPKKNVRHIRYHTPEADFDKAAATVYVSSRKDCCSGLADVDTVVGGPGSRHSSDLSVCEGRQPN
jgi:hypothetical protein